jgi:hypothetical protein
MTATHQVLDGSAACGVETAALRNNILCKRTSGFVVQPKPHGIGAELTIADGQMILAVDLDGASPRELVQPLETDSLDDCSARLTRSALDVEGRSCTEGRGVHDMAVLKAVAPNIRAFEILRLCQRCSDPICTGRQIHGVPAAKACIQRILKRGGIVRCAIACCSVPPHITRKVGLIDHCCASGNFRLGRCVTRDTTALSPRVLGNKGHATRGCEKRFRQVTTTHESKPPCSVYGSWYSKKLAERRMMSCAAGTGRSDAAARNIR